MKVTIITAAYNSGETLRDTMRSVLAQNYSDYEHVVIDGNSSDNTLEIIQNLEPEYDGRLRWISEPDHGIYDAMNKGLRMASGDIIGILNSDDFFSSPNVLTRIVREFEAADIDAVYGDIHFVDPSNLHECARYYSSRFFHPWMMVFGYQPAHPSFYCRRECYEKYGDFDTSYRVAADFENLLRLIYINHIRIRYIPMDFVTMRKGGASTSGLASHKRILMDHYRAYHKNDVVKGYCFDWMRYPFKLGEMILAKAMPRWYEGSPERDEGRGTRGEAFSERDEVRGTRDEAFSERDEGRGTRGEAFSERDEGRGTRGEAFSERDEGRGTRGEGIAQHIDI